MIRKMLLGVICIAFVATGTLNAFEVEWKTEDKTVQYKKPVVDEVIKKEPFVDDKKIYEEKKKVLDDIYNEEMKNKFEQQAPAYERGEAEVQVLEQTAPSGADVFGTQAVPQQIVNETDVPAGLPSGTSQTVQGGGPSPTGQGLPAVQGGGQVPAAGPAPAGGCTGPMIGMTNTDPASSAQPANTQGQGGYGPPPPGYDEQYYYNSQSGYGSGQGSGRPPGQYYDDDEEEDDDEGDANANETQQQR